MLRMILKFNSVFGSLRNFVANATRRRFLGAYSLSSLLLEQAEYILATKSSLEGLKEILLSSPQDSEDIETA
jgi:hypothetical protein